MAVYFAPLDRARCPGVVGDAPTFCSQLARATPLGNDWSTKVSLVVDPISPLFGDQVATSPATPPKTEG